MSTITPTERLISLFVFILDSRRGRSKAEIFRKLPTYREAGSEASREKMFERDKQMLRQIGLPLLVVEDTFFGEPEEPRYMIDRQRLRLEPLEFTAEEATAIALVKNFWADGDFASAATRALNRLETAARQHGTAAAQQQPGAEAEETLSVNHAEQSSAAQPTATDFFQISDAFTDEQCFSTIAEALNGETVLTFFYRPLHGESTQRLVSPWALIQWRGSWYLCGYDLHRRQRRNFKLSRITAATLTTVAEENYIPAQHSSQELASFLGRADHSDPAGYSPIDFYCAGPSRSAVETVLAGQNLTLSEAPGGSHISWQQPEELLLYQLICDPDITGLRFSDPQHPLVEQLVEELGSIAQAQAQASTLRRLLPQLRPVTATRRRSGTAEQLSLVFDLISYIVAEGSVTREQLRQRFQLGAAALEKLLLRIPLYGAPEGLSDELFEVHDDGNHISVAQVEAAAQPLALTPAEAFSTVVALKTMRSLRPDIGQAAESARQKILQALSRRGTDALDRKIIIDDSWTVHRSTELATLTTAITERATVLIHYGRDTEARKISPVQLKYFLGQLYVLAWCHREDAARIFRFSRIHHIQPSTDGAGAETALSDNQWVEAGSQEIFAPDEQAEKAVIYADYSLADESSAMQASRYCPIDDQGQLLAVPRVNDDFLALAVLQHRGKILVVEPAELTEKVSAVIADRLDWCTAKKE